MLRSARSVSPVGEYCAKSLWSVLLSDCSSGLQGFPAFDDASFVHEDDAVADIASEAELVGYDDHCHARAGRARVADKTSPTSSGSSPGSRFVEKHQTLGAWRGIARSRYAVAGRRKAPPDRRSPCWPSPPAPRAPSPRPCLTGLLLEHLNGAFCDVLERRHVRKQVEPLKHHAGRAPLPGDFLFAEGVERVADVAIAGQLPVEPEPAGIDSLKLVDAALRNVVLPEPEGPMMQTTSPGFGRRWSRLQGPGRCRRPSDLTPKPVARQRRAPPNSAAETPFQRGLSDRQDRDHEQIPEARHHQELDHLGVGIVDVLGVVKQVGEADYAR